MTEYSEEHRLRALRQGKFPEDPTVQHRTLLTDEEFDRLVDHLRRINDLSVTQPIDSGNEARDFRLLHYRLLHDGDLDYKTLGQTDEEEALLREHDKDEELHAFTSPEANEDDMPSPSGTCTECGDDSSGLMHNNTWRNVEPLENAE